jgi:predicted nucleic acid-binding protein
LIASQRDDRRRVAAVLQGNAQPGKHAADASHLSEAAETGCAYFITHDKRILAKRGELHRDLPPSLSIVTLTEFFEVFDRFAAERPL